MAWAIHPNVCNGDGTPIPEWIPDGTEATVTVPVLDPRRPGDMARLLALAGIEADQQDGEAGA